MVFGDEVNVKLTPEMKLIDGIRRLSHAFSTIMCRDLGAVAAEVHAAPILTRFASLKLLKSLNLLALPGIS
jgi:hypothetical protein